MTFTSIIIINNNNYKPILITSLTYAASPAGHNRFGPITTPTLLGVILLMSEYSVNFAKNFIKYLRQTDNVETKC